MQLARIIGTVVATTKDKALEGSKILMIQPLTDKLKPAGAPIAAIDTVQAGPGDLVYWITAREATLALPNTFVPVDAAITGIVDQVNIETDVDPSILKNRLGGEERATGVYTDINEDRERRSQQSRNSKGEGDKL